MAVIAMYLRLSLEDKRGMDESNSISNQRALIRDYITGDPELKKYEVKEFCDDGYSGTRMDRPGMNRLLGEVKSGRVQCIIVKDMSRFSRDYIEMGTYLNQIFPFMGVRFIALGDHYDSIGEKGSTIGVDTAFKTLLYDLYSKDLSVKVKASFESKCANGEFVFGQVPFGYRKSPEEKHKIIVDEKEAEVVSYIFSLAAKGESSGQIAKQLYAEKVPTARQMRGLDREGEGRKVSAWSSAMVRNILSNRFYLGEMVYGKTARKTVGGKSLHTPKEEWKVIPDHHEALVSPETFKQVCVSRPEISTKRQREKHPLTGKLYCGGCKYAMVYKPLREKNKYRRFECHKHSVLRIPECCTSFNADILEELVLTMINKELMIRGEAARQEGNLRLQKESCIATIKDQLADLEKEQGAMQGLKDRTYEEYAMGKWTPEKYREKVDGLDRQVKTLVAQTSALKAKLLTLEEEYERLDADMKQVIRFSHMEKLTQEVVDAFIEKIYVYKDKRVEIEWRFRER